MVITYSQFIQACALMREYGQAGVIALDLGHNVFMVCSGNIDVILPIYGNDNTH